MLTELEKLLAMFKRFVAKPLTTEKRYNKIEKVLENYNLIPDVTFMPNIEKVKYAEILEVLPQFCELYLTGPYKPDVSKRPALWELLNSVCPCTKAKKLAFNMPIGSPSDEPEIEKKPEITKKKSGPKM